MMLSSVFLFFTLVGQSPTPSIGPNPSLEFSGTPGVKIMGTCFSDDGMSEKKFEGITPTEVALEIGVQRCSITSPSKKAKVKVKLFQNRKLLLHQDLDAPTSGFEISIPFGKSKKAH